jgi:hypothetical protein
LAEEGIGDAGDQRLSLFPGAIGHPGGVQVQGRHLRRVVGAGSGQHRLGGVGDRRGDLVPLAGVEPDARLEPAEERLAVRLLDDHRQEGRGWVAGGEDVVAQVLLDLHGDRLEREGVGT